MPPSTPLFSRIARARAICRALLVFVALVLASPATSFAQLNGQNIKGDAGLKSGSQPPPGTYVAVPLYFYSADQIKDRDGKQLATGSLDSTVFGVALNVATPPVNVLLRGKDSLWGLGPEFTLALAARNTVYGFATVRYQWEFAGRTTTEGGAWNLSFVFPLKPIHLP